nr:uncharacterized protein LOC115264762 [Aedes albopictus]
MESSNLQMLLDAAAWLNDTRAPNDIDCTGTTQSVDASISRLEEFHSVGKTKTGSILDAEMNHLKRSGERTKTTSAGRRLPFLSASRQSLPDDPGCSLQERTHTTLTAEHPSLQTFSSSSESSILGPDESMVAECTGSTLSAIESIIKFEQLRTVDRAKAGPTLNVDINRLKRLGDPSVERTASGGRRLSFLSVSKRSLPVDPGCSLQEQTHSQTHTTLTAEHPSLQTFSSSSESSIIFPDELMAECTGTTVSAVESISTHQHNKPVVWSKGDNFIFSGLIRETYVFSAVLFSSSS